MNRRILKLAVPNIISNLSVPLLSSVDTALVGHLEQISYLGAIAVGGMIFNFIYWGFGFLRMGTTGLTAQAYGSNNFRESLHILLRALLVAAASSVLLIISQYIISGVSFWLIDAGTDVEKYAGIYFHIRIYAAPATLAMYALNGWFLGRQNARDPMIMTIVTNILNVAFNLFFLKIMGMHVDGVALGTVCASYLGLILGAFLVWRSLRGNKVRIDKRAVLRWQEVKKFYKLNFDIFIRTLALIFAFSFFTAKSAEAGELILAANAILMNLWTIMSYGIDGFAFAGESLTGRYVGAGDRKNLLRVIRYSFFWGIGFGTILVLIYWIFDKPILSVFTDKTDVLQLALIYMPWTIIAPVINSFCYIWDGIFIGATASSAMRNAMIVNLLLFFLPLYYVLEPVIGNHGLWLALTVFMLSRGILLSFLARKHVLLRVV